MFSFLLFSLDKNNIKKNIKVTFEYASCVPFCGSRASVILASSCDDDAAATAYDDDDDDDDDDDIRNCIHNYNYDYYNSHDSNQDSNKP